jgi:acyl-CoA synthetase (NDP forming)
LRRHHPHDARGLVRRDLSARHAAGAERSRRHRDRQPVGRARRGGDRRRERNADAGRNRRFRRQLDAARYRGIEDFLEHLGADDATTAVFLYIESFDDPARFRRIARPVAAKKPVVALIGGRTEPGGRAAAAHTGAVANDDDALDAFCDDCGVLRVKSLRRLLLAAKGFGAFPQGIGRRVLVLSNSGGPGVLCTDMAAAEGLELPALPTAMAEKLRASFPGEASVANPLDLLADAREDRFALTLDYALQHGGGAFDAILGIHVVPFMVDADPVVDRLAQLAANTEMPMMHSMMGTLEKKAEWFARLEAAGVPAFNDAEQMAECAALLARYPRLRQRALSPVEAPLAVRGRAC